MAGRGIRRPRGQALVEFALVAPVLVFILFAILEASLLLFTVGSARFAAGDAARLESEAGTNTDADSSSVTLIRTGPFGLTRLATVTSIDVQRMVLQSNGTLVADASKKNSYLLDGTAISVTWPPGARNVRSASSDYLALTINYQYAWLSGRLLGAGPLSLTQTFDVRIEPQSY
jgi:Flp pilus assembly protein TadG